MKTENRNFRGCGCGKPKPTTPPTPPTPPATPAPSK